MQTTTKPELVEIQIPFEGFYESGPAYEVDRNIFDSWASESGKYEIYQDEGEVYASKNDADIDSLEEFSSKHYREYMQEYAESYVNGLAHELTRELKMPVQFSDIELSSPREYNFTTDRIFAKVPEDVLIRLYNKTDYAKLAEYVKDHFTSRDGFASFYAGDINDPEWQNITAFDHNQWHAVLETFIEQEGIELYELAH